MPWRWRLSGRVSDHHRLLLRELLGMIRHHDQAISRLDQEIEERLRPLEEQIQRLDVIPGCSRRVMEILFAEVGWDLSPFPVLSRPHHYEAKCFSGSATRGILPPIGRLQGDDAGSLTNRRRWARRAQQRCMDSHGLSSDTSTNRL